MTASAQRPISPFDYGSAVEWTTDDGVLLSGSIYGFNEKNEGGPSAIVEVLDGTSFEVALPRLRLVVDASNS